MPPGVGSSSQPLQTLQFLQLRCKVEFNVPANGPQNRAPDQNMLNSKPAFTGSCRRIGKVDKWLSYIKLLLILDVLTLAMQHASTIEFQNLRLLALLILRFNDSRKFGTCAIPSFVMRFASSQDGVKTRIDAKDRIRYNSPSTSPFPGSAKLTVILTPTLLGIDQVRIRRLKICQFRC